MALTYDVIASTTLSSPASTITFSSIPNTYTDLRLILTGTASAGGTAPRFRLNNNSSAIYNSSILAGMGSSNSAAREVSVTQVSLAQATNWDATTTQLRIVDIMSYASANFKTLFTVECSDLRGSGSITYCSYLFRSTTAVTSIDLYLNANNYATGTVATLYGILRA